MVREICLFTLNLKKMSLTSSDYFFLTSLNKFSHVDLFVMLGIDLVFSFGMRAVPFSKDIPFTFWFDMISVARKR